MAGEHVFKLRFYMAGANWPTNPFQYRGKGTIEIGQDFVILRGSRHRSFRMPLREEQRLRMVDIVDVYASGSDVHLHAARREGRPDDRFQREDAATATASSPCCGATDAGPRASAREQEISMIRIDY